MSALFKNKEFGILSVGFVRTQLDILKKRVSENGGSLTVINVSDEKKTKKKSVKKRKIRDFLIVFGNKNTNLTIQTDFVKDFLKENVVFVDYTWINESITKNEVLPYEKYEIRIHSKEINKEQNERKVNKEETLKKANKEEIPSEKAILLRALQRHYPIDHPNIPLCKPIEELLAYYEIVLSGPQREYKIISTAKVLSALRAFPVKLTYVVADMKVSDYSVEILEKETLDFIGEKWKKKLKTLIETNQLERLEHYRNDTDCNAMVKFAKIPTVGAKTAWKWVKHDHCSSLDDVLHHKEIHLTSVQAFCIENYEDITQPMPRSDVEAIYNIVKATIVKTAETEVSGLKRVVVECCGGFRRGKPFSHDADVLFTCIPEKTNTSPAYCFELMSEVYTKALAALRRSGFMCSEVLASSTPNETKASGGHFMKHYGICVLNGRYRRVDIIGVVYSEWAFAVLGWTGSKQFERFLRGYVSKHTEYVLTSHALVSKRTKTPVDAVLFGGEEDVFEFLGLEYVAPRHRNC